MEMLILEMNAAEKNDAVERFTRFPEEFVCLISTYTSFED